MGRQAVPENERYRTVPTRLPRGTYRALTLIWRITGDTLPELTRQATTDYVRKRLKELTLELPEGYLPNQNALNTLSDRDFEAVVQKNAPAETAPAPGRRRGFIREAAEAAE
jgi:hypothetical protein